MSQTTRRLLAASAIALLFSSAAPLLLAADAGSAKGTLTMKGEEKSQSIELTHAYFFIAPDTFDEKKITRTIVFTTADERSTLDACKNTSCAILSDKDGMTVEVADASMANWWTHVGSHQMSGTAVGHALTLSVDKPDRLAGTFTVGEAGSSMVTSVTFDAPLVKTFTKARLGK